MKVFVDTPRFFIRPNNTDWRYMHSLRKLEAYIPAAFVYPQSWRQDLAESWNYIYRRLQKSPISMESHHLRKVHRGHFKSSNPDVILNHGRYPLESGDVPVVWQTAILDPEMQTARGATAARIDAAYNAQERGFQKAAVIQVSTAAEAKRHGERFPRFASKFFSCPFFLPNIEELDHDSVIDKHKNDAILKILFVGREAKRKGLPEVLKALTGLPTSDRERIHLDIVTSFADGDINFQPSYSARHHKALPQTEVLQLMREAHIFMMPSAFESYGFTLLEAMASGCCVFGPKWEVQRELLEDGLSGVNVPPNSEAIRASLHSIGFDQKKRMELGCRAASRFSTHYSAPVVANTYMRMFDFALST